VPRSAGFTPPGPDPVPCPDVKVNDLAPMPDGFLQALDDACRAAARESVRFALSRVQLRGQAGQVAASDGKQLLVQGGFAFPFAEDLLVPALPAFGARELAGAAPARLGRAGGRVVVQAGPWSFELAVDATGRFPDVQGVFPRGTAATTLVLDDADASYLPGVLPGLPGGEKGPNPVTLDLDGGAAARAQAEERCVEVLLRGARVTGPPLRVSLDRKYLYRALHLGFRTFEFHGADKPVVARDGGRLFALAPLDPKSALPPSPDALRITTDGSAPATPNAAPERKAAMTPPTPNGREPEPAEPADPLAEAEALRAALQEALGHAARLVASLRHFRRQRRSVENALASLKALHFGP
jgi:hypothetical protein